MLKRLLMLWLITSILGYGSAWAFDGCVDEAAEHQDVVGDMGNTPNEDGGHPSCDHCCHASAHIMALWPSQAGTTFPDIGIGYTPYRLTVSFNTTTPPDRPPRS